jgi:hypothetical protein
MRLIFLYGLPGVGKLTVARALSAQQGYPVFHNHLVVDALLPVFPFASPAFIDLREAIWLAVFDRAARDGLPGVIFTFAPEATVRPDFVDVALQTARDAGGSALLVELTCPLDTLRQRLGEASRQGTGKITSVAQFDELRATGAFAYPGMPPPNLRIDTGALGPVQAALRIGAAIASMPP